MGAHTSESSGIVIEEESSLNILTLDDSRVIHIARAPTHVCLGEEEHHPIILSDFIGLDLPVKGIVENEERALFFRVRAHHVLTALYQNGRLLGQAYFGKLWLQNHLNDWVYFPVECCTEEKTQQQAA